VPLSCSAPFAELPLSLFAESSERISYIALGHGYAGARSFNRTFTRMLKVQLIADRRRHRNSGIPRREGSISSGPRWIATFGAKWQD